MVNGCGQPSRYTMAGWEVLRGAVTQKSRRSSMDVMEGLRRERGSLIGEGQEFEIELGSQSSKKTLCVLPEEIIYERKGNHAALTPLEDMSAGRGQAGGGPPQNCEKVFIQRDYSEGTMVKFQTRFPTELESRLDRQLFEYTINQLNNYFAEAERASCSTYCESCLYCLTGYLISICTETHYEKCLRKVAKFVSEQNDRVYKPRGLLLTDPTTRGLRLIEISVLDRPAS
ncbi:Golgin subfamily A member 7B [Trachymyrmex cornetzi]|uniref:Ras modification protein ERF4 n=1 Tax=Trachymyrmex cornetzi TaxID=471704 RepID=A0A151IWD8_9HYME|nr:Golgin subfamily A member 7B [Trachymyrmex cornetzi]